MNKLRTLLVVAGISLAPALVSAQLVKQQSAHQATYGQFKSVEDADAYIKAIDDKVQFIKATPEQDKIAKENGWYTQMAASRKDAVEQREKLLKAKQK